MIGSNNGTGDTTLMVDKLLGDAFIIVKEVRDKLTVIEAVGEALTDTEIGAPLLTQRHVTLEGSTGNAGATTVIPFENVDIDYAKIVSSSVRILGTDDSYYFADSGYFTAKVTETGLSITLKGDAPVEVRNTAAQWFFIYEV
jgi:hypothetical protein